MPLPAVRTHLESQKCTPEKSLGISHQPLTRDGCTQLPGRDSPDHPSASPPGPCPPPLSPAAAPRRRTESFPWTCSAFPPLLLQGPAHLPSPLRRLRGGGLSPSPGPAQLFRLFSSRCVSTHLPAARASTLEFGTSFSRIFKFSFYFILKSS